MQILSRVIKANARTIVDTSLRFIARMLPAVQSLRRPPTSRQAIHSEDVLQASFHKMLWKVRSTLGHPSRGQQGMMICWICSETHCEDPPFDSTALFLLGDSTEVTEKQLADSCVSSRWAHVQVLELCFVVVSREGTGALCSRGTYIETWHSEPSRKAEKVLQCASQRSFIATKQVQDRRRILTSAIPMTSAPSLANRHSAYFFSKTFSLI
jgi:hypothetical protein